MEHKSIEKIIAKYKNGESTLEEEALLFKHIDQTEPEIKLWSTFAKHHKKESPKGLNDKLWEAFEVRKDKSIKTKYAVFAIAASILLIISISFLNQPQSYSEKEQLLNETLNMFAQDDTLNPDQTVIYENDDIVIYTESK